VSGLLVVLEAYPVVTLKLQSSTSYSILFADCGRGSYPASGPLARLRDCARLGVVAGQLGAGK
jgi:hypothetical protein